MPKYLDPVNYPDWANFFRLADFDTLPEWCRPGSGICLPAFPSETIRLWVTRLPWVNLFTEGGADDVVWMDAHTHEPAASGSIALSNVVPPFGRLAAVAPAEPGCYYMAARRLVAIGGDLFYERMDTADSCQNVRLWNPLASPGPQPDWGNGQSFTLGPGTATPSLPAYVGAGSLEVGVGAVADAEEVIVVPPAELSFEAASTYICEAYVYLDRDGLVGDDGSVSGFWQVVAGLAGATLTNEATFSWDTAEPTPQNLPGQWVYVRARIETAGAATGLPGFAMRYLSGVGSFRVDDYRIYRTGTELQVYARTECWHVGPHCHTLAVSARNDNAGFYPYHLLPPNEREVNFRVEGEVLELPSPAGERDLFYDSHGVATPLVARLWQLHRLRTGYLDAVRHRLLELALRHQLAYIAAPHWDGPRPYSLPGGYELRPAQSPYWHPTCIAEADLRMADLQASLYH